MTKVYGVVNNSCNGCSPANMLPTKFIRLIWLKLTKKTIEYVCYKALAISSEWLSKNFCFLNFYTFRPWLIWQDLRQVKKSFFKGNTSTKVSKIKWSILPFERIFKNIFASLEPFPLFLHGVIILRSYLWEMLQSMRNVIKIRELSWVDVAEKSCSQKFWENHWKHRRWGLFW